MKNKFWVLITMAGIIIGIMACDDKPKDQAPVTPTEIPCPDKGGDGHLGIDENCIKNTGDCSGLQDYNNYEPRDLTPGSGDNGFVLNKPIYRYGKEENYTPDELTLNADWIIDGFRLQKVEGREEDYKELMAAINTLCVAKPATGTYVWISDRKLFGVNAASVNVISFRLTQIRDGVIAPVGIAEGTLVQLQPASDIRLANSKKKTEQFPAVASGDGKLPKATRAAN